MERRFEVRLEQILQEPEVQTETLDDLVPRLGEFLRPFLDLYPSAGQRGHATDYVRGLLSDLPSKTAEGIAYLHNRDRQGLQKFIGQRPWDERPLIAELVRQVAGELGEADGVIVIDPSGFAKKGKMSVGVARQWCGRLGKVENSQVAIYLGYVSRREHVLLDQRLYLPKEWTGDRARRAAAGVPKAIAFRTRHTMALEMIDEHGCRLPHGWIAGDDEMGHSAEFRGELRSRGERYLLAVPSNTLVRDREAEPPPYGGHGSLPKVPFVPARTWAARLPETAWQSVEVRDGTKGPLVVEIVTVRVQTMQNRSREGPEELLVAVRERQSDGSWKRDYLLSNAAAQTPLAELARVHLAEHRIEECIRRGKSEAGLADYEVRHWLGWQHHQALALIAAWFLVRETRREKKSGAANDRGAVASAVRVRVARSAECEYPRARSRHDQPLAATQRPGGVLSLEETQPPCAA